MSFPRLLALTIPVAAALSASAQPNPPEPRPFDLARGLLQILAETEHCPHDAISEDAKEDLHAATALFLEAITDRAAALFPDAQRQDLMQKNTEWFEAGLQTAASQYASNTQSCALSTEALNANLQYLASDAFSQLLDTYREAANATVTRWPALGSANALTHATPGSQALFLSGMQKSCAASSAPADVQLVRSEPKDTSQLPPFVLAPITFREVWTFECPDGDARFEVVFSQDSDGPIGYYSVEGLPED